MLTATRLLGWPPAAAAFAAVTRRRLRIVAYHDVPDSERFARHLDLLQASFETVTGPAVADWCDGRAELPDRPIWITFDDGHPSVAEVAAPLLAERGMTATAFICAGLLDTRQPHWWDVVGDAARHGVLRVGDIDGMEGIDANAAISRLKVVDDTTRRRAVATLADRLREHGLTAAQGQWGRDDVQNWVGAGNEIGNHSWDHPCLDMCTADEQRHQVARAHERLRLVSGVTPISFAWPNGDPGAAAEEEARRLGYRLILLFDHRLCAKRPAPFALSRLRLDADADATRVRAIVAGAHSGLLHARQTMAEAFGGD